MCAWVCVWVCARVSAGLDACMGVHAWGCARGGLHGYVPECMCVNVGLIEFLWV